MNVRVRKARPTDHPVLVDYNRRMAWDTEQKKLDDDVLSLGVSAVLADPAKGFYLVAESEGDVVGQLMITMEWSDWSNGFFWWIQSVYVSENARRLGVFRTLYREIEAMAKATGNTLASACTWNARTPRSATYESLGLKEEGYFLSRRGPL